MPQKQPHLVRELASFDVLADVLGTLGLRTRLICRTELAPPWVLAFDRSKLAHFHVLERGAASVEIEGASEPIACATGDLVVIARGTPYRIADRPGRIEGVMDIPAPDPSGRCVQLRHGGDGANTVLVCGSFSFEHAEDHPIVALLPQVMHLRAGASHSDVWLDAMSRFLTTEAASMKPGAATILSRLTDILFVQVLRAWLAEQPDHPSWLKALKDPRIGPALALMHERPAQAWTVDALAARVGLTRSPFTVRFTRVVGEPPQTYLTRLRMQRAARLLREHGDSLGEIALAVGYESESSFNKAFKRQYQKTPGQFRRDERESDTQNVA